MAVNESKVKEILRSILVSSQSKQTAFTLRLRYYQLIGHDIPFKKLGYNSLIEFLQSIPDVLRINGTSADSEVTSVVMEKTVYIFNSEMKKQKPSEGKLSSERIKTTIGEVLKKRDRNPQQKIIQKQPLSTLLPQLNNLDKYWRYTPANCLRFGEFIESCPRNDFIVGHKIPIIISTICNPGEFWITKKNTVFTRMMKVMQNFYASNRFKSFVPKIALTEFLFCVVSKSGEFQRGLIVDLSREVEGYVNVYLIDSGIVQCTLSEQIYFLDRQFSHLPAQALKVQLSNIQPVKEVWSEQSTKRFVDFVSGKDILAKISMTVDGKISAYISEDCYPSKILNDVLVKEGLASLGNKKIIKRCRGAPRERSAFSEMPVRSSLRIGPSCCHRCTSNIPFL
ncbi:hypothetical protein WA026_011891 [Henosepilachna vigintioctopunctata]|uniref:HTH OST-type domain-containing protein n=1 Tax=Henosepilachna vigintioctopunctata TaxID=420089 RepID=A0AAW1UKP0_9CUCU